MTKPVACPPDNTLKQLLAGKIDDPRLSELIEHLEQCGGCQEKAKTFSPDDTFSEPLRSDATAAKKIADGVPRPIIDKAKEIASATGSDTQALAKGELTDGDAVLDFLAPAQAPDEVGRLGPYRVLKVLGKGGMGMVLLADDPDLDRRVALKVMLPKFAANVSAKQRFLREARAAAKLKSDHIVGIYQVGEERNIPYLAMELLEGAPLDQFLEGGRKLTMAQILRIGREAAKGLAAAHEKGLIHRDIKPGNLWLDKTNGGRVKVLDFGLARSDTDDIHLTQSGAIVGTPAYMAPEQAHGDKNVDARADLFSLGCVLYRLCTGDIPFKADTTMGVLLAIATKTPTAPLTVNAQIPTPLSQLIMELLQKEPSKRPASARAVIDRLSTIEKSLAAAKSEAAAIAPTSVTEPAVAKSTVEVRKATPAAPARRSRTPVLVAVGLACAGFLALLLLGGTVFYWQTRDGRVVRIECDDPAIKIAFEDGELKVVGAYKEPLSLKPGKNGIKIKKGDFEFETDKFIVNRGDKIALKIEVVDGKVQIVQAGKGVLDSKELPKSAPAPGVYALDFGQKDVVHVPGLQFGGLKHATLEAYVRTNPIPLSVLGTPKAAGAHPPIVVGVPDQISLRWHRPMNEAVLYSPGQKTWPRVKLPTPSRWVHLAAVRAGDKSYLFVDGKKVGETTHTDAEVAKSKLPFQIGGDLFFLGEVREVRASSVSRYTSDFTPAQRLESDKDTLALLHMDEGSGDVLKDSSGNGHHGKIVGAKWVKVERKEIYPEPVPSTKKEKPFLLIHKNGEREDFKSMSGVVPNIKDGDTIEVHGNGPFEMGKIELKGKSVTLKAAAGYRPRFLPHVSVYSGQPIWIAMEGGDLALIGCDFLGRPPSAVKNEQFHLLRGKNAALSVRNCRVLGVAGLAGVEGKSLRVENSLLVLYSLGVLVAKTDCHFENNVVYCSGPLEFNAPGGQRLTLRNNTFCIATGNQGGICLAQPNAKDITITAEGNCFDFAVSHNGRNAPIAFLDWRGRVAWQGSNNLYRGLGRYSLDGKETYLGLDGWAKLTGKQELGAREAGKHLHYTFEQSRGRSLQDLMAGAQKTVDDSRKQSGIDDAGPDFALIGPGDAYLKALAAAGKPVPANQLRPEAEVGGPCVLLRAGKAVAGFPMPQDAVLAARDGDIIEIRSDGIFGSISTPADRGVLTVRAGPGYRPVFNKATIGADYPDTTLILEGLHFRDGSFRTAAYPPSPVEKHGRIARIANCSFESALGHLGTPNGMRLRTGKGKATEIVNCWFSCQMTLYGIANSRVEVRNSVLQSWHFDPRDAGPCTLDLDRCLFLVNDLNFAASAVSAFHVGQGTGQEKLADLRVNARRTIFETHRAVYYPLNPMKWTGARNIFRVPETWLVLRPCHGLATWRTIKDIQEENSSELDAPLYDPAQWRLLANSPGHRSAPGGKDFGADIDRVASTSVNADGRPIEAFTNNLSPVALAFDGKASHVTVPSLGYDGNHPLTAEAWVVLERPADADAEVLLGNPEGAGFQIGAYRVDGQQRWSFDLNLKAKGYIQATQKQPLQRKQFVHLAGVYDGKAEVRFYVNGQLQDRKPAQGVHRPSAMPFTLGADPDPDGKFHEFFAGRLNEVRISKVARYDKDFTPQKRFEPDKDTLALYHCDEGTGDVLADSSGNKHHGKIVGATWVKADGTPVAPPTHYALLFEGHATKIKSLQVDTSRPFTIEGYFTQTKIRVGNQGALWGLSNSNMNAYIVGANAQGRKWTFGVKGTTKDYRVGGTAPIRVGTKVHVAGVFDGRHIRVYLDGQLAEQKEIDPGDPLRPLDDEFRVGGFDGLISEVRISKSARYAKDFTPLKRFEPDADTIALYHFDEGSGDVFKDTSGNKHDGKIYSGKWVKGEGTPIVAPPSVDYAMRFDGKSQVEVATLKLDEAGPFTLEGYLKLAKPTPGFAIAFRTNQFTVSTALWLQRSSMPRIKDVGRQIVGLGMGGPRVNEMPIERRIHFAAVRSGTSYRIYLDGKPFCTREVKQPLADPQGAFLIGAGLDGILDEIRISKVARYDKDFTPAKRFESDADTLALYHFDEGFGDVLKDSSGNNHHGKIVGAKWVKADGSPLGFAPLDPAWLKAVAAMKSAQQIEAVKAELMKHHKRTRSH